MAESANTTTPSKFNKSRIMKRAWGIFKSTYSYPAIPFKSIGRRCFSSCLKSAWAEIKRPAIVASISLAEKLASLKSAHMLNQMTNNRYATNGGYAATADPRIDLILTILLSGITKSNRRLQDQPN